MSVLDRLKLSWLSMLSIDSGVSVRPMMCSIIPVHTLLTCVINPCGRDVACQYFRLLTGVKAGLIH